jgi:hypothetical protein
VFSESFSKKIAKFLILKIWQTNFLKEFVYFACCSGEVPPRLLLIGDIDPYISLPALLFDLLILLLRLLLRLEVSRFLLLPTFSVFYYLLAEFVMPVLEELPLVEATVVVAAMFEFEDLELLLLSLLAFLKR